MPTVKPGLGCPCKALLGRVFGRLHIICESWFASMFSLRLLCIGFVHLSFSRPGIFIHFRLIISFITESYTSPLLLVELLQMGRKGSRFLNLLIIRWTGWNNILKLLGDRNVPGHVIRLHLQTRWFTCHAIPIWRCQLHLGLGFAFPILRFLLACTSVSMLLF